MGNPVMERRHKQAGLAEYLKAKLRPGEQVQVCEMICGGIDALLRAGVRLPTRINGDCCLFGLSGHPLRGRARGSNFSAISVRNKKPRFVVIFSMNCYLANGYKRLNKFPELKDWLNANYRTSRRSQRVLDSRTQRFLEDGPLEMPGHFNHTGGTDCEPASGGVSTPHHPLSTISMPTDDQVQVHWHQHAVAREEREERNRHAGCVVWFTGLSACGKSTVANLLDHRLHSVGVNSFVLDGDNVRHGLNAAPAMLKDRHGEEFAKRFGLGFSAQDREENIRRIGAVAKLFCDAGMIAITAFISPYRIDRDRVRASLGEGDFIEIFVDAPIEVCEARDPKGLYKKARAGELRGFTGIDDPYEPPLKPELILDAAQKSPEALADEVIKYLKAAGKIPA